MFQLFNIDSKKIECDLNDSLNVGRLQVLLVRILVIVGPEVSLCKSNLPLIMSPLEKIALPVCSYILQKFLSKIFILNVSFAFSERDFKTNSLPFVKFS